MCSCGGLLTEEGIQHVPAPGVCERMGGGLLDSPRFVAVERGLAELREVLGRLRAVSTSADERCGILDARVTKLDEWAHSWNLENDAIRDEQRELAARVEKLEQAEARREKLAAVRADRLERAGEGIYVPPPMAKPEPARPRDCLDPETCGVGNDGGAAVYWCGCDERRRAPARPRDAGELIGHAAGCPVIERNRMRQERDHYREQHHLVVKELGTRMADLAQLRATVARVNEWADRYGASLCPGGADTFGDGMRAAKEQVKRLLSGEG
jgi:hypothetical protein